MLIDYACPGCQQPLQVPEDYLGRSIACPSCKHVFRLGPAPSPPPPPPRDDRPPLRDREDDYERRRSREFEYDDRPRRRPGYAEAEDRRHWRSRADSAHTMGLLACILCWMPLIGLILGIIAYSTASGDLARMAYERSGDLSTRVRFESAKSMGMTGIIISAVLFVTCCTFNVAMMNAPMRRW